VVNALTASSFWYRDSNTQISLLCSPLHEAALCDAPLPSARLFFPRPIYRKDRFCTVTTQYTVKPGPHQRQCRSNIVEATAATCCLLLRHCCWCGRRLTYKRQTASYAVTLQCIMRFITIVNKRSSRQSEVYSKCHAGNENGVVWGSYGSLKVTGNSAIR